LLRYLQRTIIFLLLISPWFSNSASACVVFAPLVDSDIKHADIIFQGKLTNYELVSEGKGRSLGDYGILSFRVTDVIKGSVENEVQIYWHNSTFGMPDSIKKNKEYLVAAVKADHSGLPLRGPSATILGTQRPDLYRLMQAPCSEPFMFFKSKESQEIISAILEDKPVSPEGAYLESFVSAPEPEPWWWSNSFCGVLEPLFDFNWLAHIFNIFGIIDLHDNTCYT